tara:strand:- start:27 stop:305 length:279 start_codon:yes stop_codon:yes gene_type:complete
LLCTRLRYDPIDYLSLEHEDRSTDWRWPLKKVSQNCTACGIGQVPNELYRPLLEQGTQVKPGPICMHYLNGFVFGKPVFQPIRKPSVKLDKK